MTDDADRRLDKQIRSLQRKLERSEEQRRMLELVNDQSQSLLRTVRREIEEGRALIEQQHRQLEVVNERIAAEQAISEALLLNILPAPIAARLKAQPGVIADSFDEVTVLFADIVGFTSLSARETPEALVEMLDEIFSEFDLIAERRGLEKIKTIGDAYMVAAGIPTPCADHAARGAEMALDMVEVLTTFNERRGRSLSVRIGLNSGSVVAGVIGRRKFVYDLWGDAVNTASRMESHGIPGRAQLTDTTRVALGEAFSVEERGVIEVKGKGPLRTWLLVGRA